MSKFVAVDKGTDARGMRWEVGRRGPNVAVYVDPRSAFVELDGEQRDRFIRAWAEAERVIEREDAELEHRRELLDRAAMRGR